MDIAQLEGSVGPELDVAILKVGGKPVPVGFTKPKDVSAFTAQLKKAKSEQIGGWTVFASTQARARRGQEPHHRISRTPPTTRMRRNRCPVDTLASAFAGKSAFALAGPLADQASSRAGAAASAINLSKLGWIAGAATAHDNGIELELHVHSTSTPPPRRARSRSPERSPAACWRPPRTTGRATSRP